MVQRKSFIESATRALSEMCFPSIFMDEMLVVLHFLFKMLFDGLPCIFKVSFAGSNFVSEIVALKFLI